MINVFIGLTLSFGTISLMVSTMVEAMASILNWRSKTLLSGLQMLLNDKQLDGLALDVLNHAAANPLSAGIATAPPASYWKNLLQKLSFGSPEPLPASAGAAANVRQPLTTLPSYIATEQFAAALIDVINNCGHGYEGQTDFRDAIKSIADHQLQTMLLGMYDRAGEDLGAFQKRIASWFDASMARLSGIYKRRTQVWSFGIALGLAALLNVDAIALARQLWVSPAISADATAIKTLPDYQTAFALWSASFPFGWALPKAVAGTWGYPVMAFGWLLTAFATLFGAPFWFDTLQRFVQLRGTGNAPDQQHS
jgi:hypothetical protein